MVRTEPRGYALLNQQFQGLRHVNSSSLDLDLDKYTACTGE